jgi:hypothetical protein
MTAKFITSDRQLYCMRFSSQDCWLMKNHFNLCSAVTHTVPADKMRYRATFLVMHILPDPSSIRKDCEASPQHMAFMPNTLRQGGKCLDRAT